MKALAILFMVLIGFALAMQPPLYQYNGGNCCSESCSPSSCDMSDEGPQGDDKNGCSPGACNPFMVCSFCGFILQQPVVIPRAVAYPQPRRLFYAHYVGLLASYVPSFFHPPEASVA